MKIFLILFISIVPAYLLGGVNGAIIASKYLYRKDIRKFGSGNPGLTNFYRVFGKGGALLVVLIDAAKTIGPVLFGGWLFGRYFDMMLFGRALTGFFAMLGHCYPVYYKFKGGKGVMASGAIIFFVDWRVALIAWGVFLLVTAVTRYVSLGSILGISAYPVFLFIFGTGGTPELIVAIIYAALMIARHHTNIVRLIRGEESKFSFKT